MIKYGPIRVRDSWNKATSDSFQTDPNVFVVILHTEAIPLFVVSYSRHVLPLLVYSHLLLTPNR